MSEPNTTIHNETTQLPPNNGGNPAGQEQPAATAAEPKNNAQPGEQPAPEAPTKVEEPAAPSSPNVGFVARAKENWDVAVAGAAIGVAAGLAVGALCFGGKEEAAVVV